MIPSSYVKWIEQTGLKVIPIQYDLSKDKMQEILEQINGALITGGSA